MVIKIKHDEDNKGTKLSNKEIIELIAKGRFVMTPLPPLEKRNDKFSKMMFTTKRLLKYFGF